MDNNIEPKHRQPIKDVLKSAGLHKVITKNVLDELCDNLHEIYSDKIVELETHENHLAEQLQGWVTHLETIQKKIGGNSEYSNGVRYGFETAIKELKEVTKNNV